MSKIKMRLRDKDPIKLKLKNAVQKMYPSLEDLYVVPSGEVQTFKSEDYYGYDSVKVDAINLQEKTVTPTKEEQIIKADDNYSGLKKVEVKPIPDNYIEPTGTLDITQNGEYDVTNYKNVNTDIHEPTPYAPRYILFREYTGSELDEELASLDTSNITNMRNMFASCTYLKKIDLSNFNTSKVTDMGSMFSSCMFAEEIVFGKNFNTSKVTNMANMFATMSYIKTLDLSVFDTSSVTNMANMFANNQAQTINVSSFSTPNVTDMSYMFNGSRSFKSLDLSKFNTSKVTNMRNMFSSTSLESLDVSDFDASSVNNIYGFLQYVSTIENLSFMNNLGKGFTNKSSNYTYYQVDFSSANQLTHDSLMDIINKLYDLNLTYDVVNGGTLYTQKLTLGSTNLAKLTAEEIAIATNKGWTVS